MSNGIVRSIAAAAAISVCVTAGEAAALPAAVKLPEDAPEFLAAPYPDDIAMSVVGGWYYQPDQPGVSSYCDYKNFASNKRHCAIDYGLRVDRTYRTFPVLAVCSGLASRTFDTSGGSSRAELQCDQKLPDGRGLCFRFVHVTNAAVAPVTGSTKVRVEAGQQIAWAGNTGTKVIHLHFVTNVSPAGKPVSCTATGSVRADPYDIGLQLIDQRITPTLDYYPGRSRYAGCGAARLWSPDSEMCP
jgi:hypothetical protein